MIVGTKVWKSGHAGVVIYIYPDDSVCAGMVEVRMGHDTVVVPTSDLAMR